MATTDNNLTLLTERIRYLNLEIQMLHLNVKLRLYISLVVFTASIVLIAAFGMSIFNEVVQGRSYNNIFVMIPSIIFLILLSFSSIGLVNNFLKGTKNNHLSITSDDNMLEQLYAQRIKDLTNTYKEKQRQDELISRRLKMSIILMAVATIFYTFCLTFVFFS